MHPRPVQPHIPVLWGGHSAAALRRAVLAGDGWHPLGIGTEEVARGLETLWQLCDARGRDRATVQVVVSIGAIHRATRDTLDRLHALDIRHFVVNAPLEDGHPGQCVEAMRRVTQLAGLQARG